MLKAYNMQVGYVRKQVYCVVAPDMASADRAFRRKYGENARISSIELHSEHVVVAPDTPQEDAHD